MTEQEQTVQSTRYIWEKPLEIHERTWFIMHESSSALFNSLPLQIAHNRHKRFPSEWTKRDTKYNYTTIFQIRIFYVSPLSEGNETLRSTNTNVVPILYIHTHTHTIVSPLSEWIATTTQKSFRYFSLPFRSERSELWTKSSLNNFTTMMKLYRLLG